MNAIETIILGIVEGVTEFLPISSTAHLEIAREFLRLPATDFAKSFEIIIQLGAILSVFFLYSQKIFSSARYAINILIAFIPTGIIGLLLYSVIKSILLGNVVLASSVLVLGGAVILIFEHKTKKVTEVSQKTIETLTVKELLILGSAQGLAVVPGVSRSGALIVAGRMLNFSAPVITDFAFLVAIPTMLAASGYDLLRSGFSWSGGEWGILALGFIVAFIVALFTAKWLINYVKNHDFKIFGWYRIIFGILALLFLL